MPSDSLSGPLCPQERTAVVLRPKPQPRPEIRKNRQSKTFWWITVGLLSFVSVKGIGQTPECTFGAWLIILAALLPSYLWISKRVLGMPIFPLYSLTAVWIYAIPLVAEHPIVIQFPAYSQFTAAISVAFFLLVATGAWYVVARREPKRIVECWMFDESRSDGALVLAFGVISGLLLAVSAGWINTELNGFSVFRAVLLAMEALVAFVLSYHLGQNRLPVGLRLIFYLLFGETLLVSVTSLLLINAMSLLGLAALAYSIASRRLPWRICLSTLVIIGFLHSGKAPMREKYWREEDSFTISPSSYPSFFLEWVKTSLDVIRSNDIDDQPESLMQRASLMHLLLYIQNMTPRTLPYLHGESYKAVPIQFLPRMFYPEKPRSHEGTYILSIYYNLQTREDTELTTIDIGLLNEAYANFGYLGMAGLAVLLGTFFAATALWSRHAPIISLRSLFAVLVLGSILGASSSASFYIATLYQNSVVLLLLSLVFMRPMRPNSLRNSCLE